MSQILARLLLPLAGLLGTAEPVAARSDRVLFYTFILDHIRQLGINTLSEKNKVCFQCSSVLLSAP